MSRLYIVALLVLILTITAGCGGNSSSIYTPPPLTAGNINLIFVVSDDLAYNALGDINPTTANLTNQGLQRSLLMGSYLQQQVIGKQNVTGIYVLEPMTHLQTANNYPDMAGIWTVQQFALLNQVSLSVGTNTPYTANSYPLNASYAPGQKLPNGVASPLYQCPGCQGLDFNDTGGDNEALAAGIINTGIPGFYVFSAPWETTSALITNINRTYGYNLNVPTSFVSPNYVYAISISPAGGTAKLVAYNTNFNPSSTYPVLPAAVAATACTAQTPFTITASVSNGATISAGINKNETVYLIRHAEAHPSTYFEDGNYVAAGQWRALYLPTALQGKINPTLVYSIDPAQVLPNSLLIASIPDASYVRPSLTIEPYAIANNLPYYLVSNIEICDVTNSPQETSRFFFFGGTFSNQTILLAWEHDHFPPTVDALLANFFPSGTTQSAPAWPGTDYDTIWTIKLDSTGNLTVNNSLCEGIDSTQLPVTAPQF